VNYDLIESSRECPSCQRSLDTFVTVSFQPTKKPKTFKISDTFRTPDGLSLKSGSFNFFSLCTRCSHFLKGEGKIEAGHIIPLSDTHKAKLWVSARAYFDGLQEKQDSENVAMYAVLKKLVPNEPTT